MPAGAKYIGRGSKWGNPYTTLGGKLTAEEVVVGYAFASRCGYDHVPPPEQIVTELAGQDLACWCPVDAPDCHGDYLLHVANGGDPGAFLAR